jgi:large subunit ribosomal protein L31
VIGVVPDVGDTLTRGSGSRPGAPPDDPATIVERTTMQKDIHPAYVDTTVTCTCGNTFVTRSTASAGTIRSDVCSQCHPFYTGKQKILDTGGRVARFEKRYAASKGK